MRDRRRGSAELFPTDMPLAPDDMIGRADDVDSVARTLVGGGHVIIAGPRRTGKTSVCDAAVAVCAVDECHTAAVDLFHHADAAQLAEALTVAVLANRPVIRRALTAAREEGRRLAGALAEVGVRRALGELGLDLGPILDPGAAAAEPTRALLTALELPERVAVADGRRFVLFFDEFQEVASPRGLYGDPDTVTRQMRAVFQRSSHVSVLFAGSMEHLMRDLFAPTERAFSQFGAYHELGPITDSQWTEGLPERFALDDCVIADTALDRLIRAGEGHPRATMLIAQKTHELALEELTREVDDALVSVGLDRAMLADRLKHEQQLERIRLLGRHAQKLAQRVAIGATLYEGLAPQTASRTLDALRDAGIADRHQRRWSITDPLLRRYLANLVAGGL